MNKLVVRALRLLLPLALLLVVLRLLDGGDGVAPKAETPDDAAAPADPVEGAGAADIPFIRAPDRNKEAYFKLKEQRIARGRRRRQQRDAERESSKTRSDYWKPPADAVLRARWKRRLMEDCEGVEDEGTLNARTMNCTLTLTWFLDLLVFGLVGFLPSIPSTCCLLNATFVVGMTWAGHFSLAPLDRLHGVPRGHAARPAALQQAAAAHPLPIHSASCAVAAAWI